MSVSKNRLLDKEFIKKRWNKFKKIGKLDTSSDYYVYGSLITNLEKSKLKNNNIINQLMNGGRAKKRKARHASATYRHHGAYGKAIQRNVNELRQYEDMNQQMKEYMDEDNKEA